MPYALCDFLTNIGLKMFAKDNEYKMEIDSLGKGEWSNLLLEFDDATIYQTWSYGVVRWGQDNLSHVVIKRNNEVIAAAQLRILKIPLFNAGIAYLSWGPMWRRHGFKVELNIFEKVIKVLKEEYAVKRGLFLRIQPNVLEENSAEIVSVLYKEGFKKNLEIQPYRTLMLDLSPGMNEIRKALDQKWRNQLNRAEKNNLKIIVGNSDELYRIFLDIQKEMHDRKKYVPGVDYGEFREMQKDLPEVLKMIIIICEYSEKGLTATIGSKIGDTGVYLLGATGDEGMKMKGAYISQWRLIEIMKESGCQWYDLGGIDPENNPGVYHFKSGLSQKEVRHIGQFEISKSKISSLLVRGVESARKSLRRN
jgi:lipid II:glycine glycyltransferase (peptidoglycan interpeptide bridge formation enzyme)